MDGATGLFAVIKKSGRSFVRPVDPLEQLVLKRGVGVNGPELLSDTPRLGEDPALANDVVNLVRAISIVGKTTTVFLYPKIIQTERENGAAILIFSSRSTSNLNRISL